MMPLKSETDGAYGGYSIRSTLLMLMVFGRATIPTHVSAHVLQRKDERTWSAAVDVRYGGKAENICSA